MIRRTVLEVGLALAVLYSTTAFGASPVWATAPLLIAAFLLLAIYLFPFPGDSSLAPPSRLTWVVVFSLAAVPVIQLVPLPGFLQRLLSPVHADFIERLSREGLLPESPFRHMLSICPYATWSQFKVFVALLGLFLIGRALFLVPAARTRLFGVLGAIGLFQAGFGLSQYFGVFPQVLPDWSQRAVTFATGTYVNRDHYAGLLELCLPLFLGLAYSFLTNHVLPETPFWRRSIFAALLHPKAPIFLLLLFLAAMLGLGIIFSLSRSGIFALTATLVLLVILLFAKHRQHRVNLLGLSFAFLVLGYATWIGVDEVLKRFGNLVSKDILTTESRFMAWRDTTRLIQDFPVTGTGLGTYYFGFNRYESVAGNQVFDHAHNDYLEYLAELGIPAGGFLIGSTIWLLVVGIRVFLRTSNHSLAGTTFGAIGGVFSLLLHSFTDFNLHIPANMVVFTLLLSVLAGSAALYRQGLATGEETADETPDEDALEEGATL